MPRKAPYGFQRSILGPFSVGTNVLNSTAAVVQALSMALGFGFVVEKLIYTASVAHAGGGGSRVLNVRKGSASGTIVATVTPTTAALGTAGNKADGTVTASAAEFSDADTLTIEAPSGGTAITSGTGELWIVVRQLAQRER